jgi:hypothetical protein
MLIISNFMCSDRICLVWSDSVSIDRPGKIRHIPKNAPTASIPILKVTRSHHKYRDPNQMVAANIAIAHRIMV